jgi:mevalonate kinase
LILNPDSPLRQKRIPAKLLLAGEFTVLTGGNTLGIPFHHFYGTWAKHENPDIRLKELYEFLLEKNLVYLDLGRFATDINEGWRFDSSIPEGYGLGSSGALSAGILARYGIADESTPYTIQQRLATIESYYHGTSSGFDPLIAYTASACIVRNGTTQVLNIHHKIADTLRSRLFLIDSKTQRNTIVPIEWFYVQLRQKRFKEAMEELNQLNDQLIGTLQEETYANLNAMYYQISLIQSEYFQPLIAEPVKDLWTQGLTHKTHYCKLCGKGGGGYYFIWLDCTREKFHELYPDTELIQIF